MRASPLQNNFSSGEFSPLTAARVELDRFKASLAVCLNYFPLIQGPITRRPGTKFVAEAKNANKKARLVRFEFSTTQAYILEFGDQYLRFYKDNGQILSSGTPYEISTTYLEADLEGLKFTQSVDVLYITHPSYPPRKITRTGHTSWTITTIDFKDGPYLPLNSTAVTIMPSAGTGTGVTLTASAPLFAATDVGRLVRFKTSSPSWAKITGFTNSTNVTADVKGGDIGTDATVNWRLGVYSGTTGYPAACMFHEDRLWLGGPRDNSQRADASRSSDYENFAPTESDGSVVASNAISFSLNSNDVNAIRWMVSDEKGLLMGTVGGEWVVRPSSQSEAISPTNVTAKRATSYGSENVQAVQFGKGTLFVQRAGRKIRELNYFYDVDGFRATDLTALSEHVTKSGIKEFCFTQDPQSFLWCVREDGALAAMTYERDVDNLKAGWHRHILGGYADESANHAQVESAAVIPSADGTRSELWVLVKRLINGTTKRYVEYMTQIFDDSVDQLDGYFVDCGLSYNDPKAITDISNASPPVVTANSHGFADGDKVLLTDILGVQKVVSGEAEDESFYNRKYFTVANKTTNTFELQGENSAPLTGYLAGGYARKLVSTISGLTHLEGESVSVIGDGAVQANKTVSSGAITLASPAAVVHIGFKYNSDAQLQRFEAGSADGTALGKKRRTNEAGFFLHRTLGMKIGTSFERMNNLVFRKTSDALNAAPPLFSGITRQRIEADHDFENQICIRQDKPGPGTVLAVMPQMVTQDAG